MKPFDLELALAGHPVMHLCGSKGYVRYKETSILTAGDNLLGYYDNSVYWTPFSLQENGKPIKPSDNHLEIVGMWQEKPDFQHWDALDPRIVAIAKTQLTQYLATSEYRDSGDWHGDLGLVDIGSMTLSTFQLSTTSRPKIR